MGGSVPVELQRLLVAPDDPSRAAAWERLIAEHSHLLIRVARSLGGGHDEVMDRYAFMLERLRQADCRRLRAYVPDSNAKFTTWLAVVARRLCFDQHRERYGRPLAPGSESANTARTRRQLEDLVSAELDLDQVADPAATDPAISAQTQGVRDVLRRALAALDPGDRLLLKLRFEDDLPAREIAELVHLPTPFHVYRRLKAALALLRNVLDQAGIEGPRG
jgi:RNA polymerase sigma factor (sigma-70 family)